MDPIELFLNVKDRNTDNAVEFSYSLICLFEHDSLKDYLLLPKETELSV